MHTASSRSTPAWRTDNIINSHTYGHGDGMFGVYELPVFRTSGNGSSGHRDLNIGSKSESKGGDGMQVGVVGVGGRCNVVGGHDAVGVGGRCNIVDGHDKMQVVRVEHDQDQDKMQVVRFEHDRDSCDVGDSKRRRFKETEIAGCSI